MNQLRCTLTIVCLFATASWAKEIEWQKNYDAALAQAKKEQKILLVDIYTDWCGWCKKLDRDTYSSKDVQAKVAKDFIAVKINPEKSADGQKLAQQFDPKGVLPFLVFIDSNGKQIAQIDGYVNAATFLIQLEKVAKPTNGTPK